MGVFVPIDPMLPPSASVDIPQSLRDVDGSKGFRYRAKCGWYMWTYMGIRARECGLVEA